MLTQQITHSSSKSKSKPNTSKSNVLLVTSSAPSQSPFSTTEKRPPLGIGYLISILRNAGHNVFFVDNYLKPSNFLETDYLQRNHIDYVGIYTSTICYRDTLRMLYKLEWLRHTRKWQGKIIIGGPHTTVCLDTIPEFVDFIVQGEGEQAILDIIEGNVSERILKYPRVKDLDHLPMPAWDYFIKLPYNWSGEWFTEKPIFTMNTSRGCPYRCSFCSVGSIWGKRYTYFSAERIADEVEYLVRQYNAKGIYFREDNFTFNKNRVIDFCNSLLKKGIKIQWVCESRVDTLDKDIVELMAKAGACGFYFGVESGSQRILNALKKDITVDQIIYSFDLCHQFGIKAAASILVGAPTETQEDINKTYKLLERINPNITWYNVFVGIPNSELYQFILKNKLYEFIDDRGLAYLRGHNRLVKKYYGGKWDAEIPSSLYQSPPLDPLVSVIMSVYNGEKYLKEAVESILRQTFQDFEFIIVDDGSTDKTSEILNSFDDLRIKVIKNSQNLGLTKSLNKAIEIAKGKYIARMDADDISLPHRLEKQIEFLEKNPEYAMIGSSYYKIDDEGTTLSLVSVLTADSQIKEGLDKQNWFCHGSAIIRKDALLKVGTYNEKFKYAQDYDLWLRISEFYSLANIEEPLYCWRTSPTSISIEKESEQRYYANLAILEAQGRRMRFSAYSKNGLLQQRPMVSIIVPTYNRPQMLNRALKSILNQTYKDFEVFVVNDGGENVENIVTSLNKEGKITYIRHGTNRGLATSRNTGIKLARGKYISYLDDDDIFYPSHLETLVNFLELTNYQVAYTDAYYAHQEKENGKYVTKDKTIRHSVNFDDDLILIGNFIPVICVIHERSCLDKVGYFDENLGSHEDWDLWIRMSREFRFAHIKRVTAEVSWREDGSTMTSGKRLDFLRTLKIIYERTQKYVKNKPHIVKKREECLRSLEQECRDLIIR